MKPLAIVPILLSLALYPLNAVAQSHVDVQGTTKPEIGKIITQKEDRSAERKKLSSQIVDVLDQTQTGHVVSGVPTLQAQNLDKLDGKILVDIRAKVSPELLAEITRLGGQVINKSERFNAIRAALPLDSLEPLVKRQDVDFIGAAAKARTNVDVAHEGDVAHTSDLVRTKFGVTGSGVKVCVLSDSIDDGAGAEDLAFRLGALDASKTTVLEDQQGEGTGEGLAMLEIIHAVAPDAELSFATGFSSPAQMATNILEFRDKGCNVIVDDISYADESPFQDDAISQAVQEVSDSGVLYFSSASNSGNMAHKTSSTWEGMFQDGGPAGPEFGESPGAHLHVFEDKITLNTVDQARGTERADLFWNDPSGRSTNDYDLFLVDSKGKVIRASTTSQTGTQDPYESIYGIQQGQSLVIVKRDGAADRYLHLDVGRAKLRHATNGRVRGHNASGAANAFSVAAVRVPSPAAAFASERTISAEAFSSDGPRRMFFGSNGNDLSPKAPNPGGNVLLKPDFAAADGVSTTLPRDSGLNPFFGTSAAAPHAAGIAALLLSCSPRPTPAQVRAALEASAIPLEGTVPNDVVGRGLIGADRAAEQVCHLPPVAAASSDGGKP